MTIDSLFFNDHSRSFENRRYECRPHQRRRPAPSGAAVECVRDRAVRLGAAQVAVRRDERGDLRGLEPPADVQRAALDLIPAGAVVVSDPSTS